MIETSGSFTSPRYPSNYPNSATCTWIIEVPENHFVELLFETFELEDCFIPFYSCWSCDHVEVRDGKTGHSKLLDIFCGGSNHSSLQSSGRHMWVEFASDLMGTKKGFKATFKAGKYRCKLQVKVKQGWYYGRLVIHLVLFFWRIFPFQ